ncbi:MAG: HlyD family type I secretion periplasmic adaptor subunit [Geminicoccaceae bacterium]|nr:HlyD family type I secretion periplasmic adaptor subunit [Geminicoccaceae bacterium]
MARTLDDAGLFHDARSLLESRPSPWAGAVLFAVAALIAAIVLWAATARVEEVVQAVGRLEPAGKVKLVNHPRGGRIAEIYVGNGDRVAAGAPLLRLEGPVELGAYAELLGRWQVKAVESARLWAEAHGGPIRVDPELARERPDLLEAQTRLMESRAAALGARRAAAERAVETRSAEVRSAAAEEARIKNSLVLLQQQLAAVNELTDRGLYPKLKQVQVERQVKEAEAERAKAEAALAAARNALAEAEAKRWALEEEWRSEVLAELQRVTAERDRLYEQVLAQVGVLDTLLVTAPVDGIVQDLAVTGPGQSVGANETILRLVPEGEGLVVAARVANEDIGRVRPGLPARLKVRSFDYLRFGTLDARVETVAADATPEPGGQSASYVVTLVVDRQELGSRPGEFALQPGMLVDVELRVGERTILSYLTDRLWRWADTAFREG